MRLTALHCLFWAIDVSEGNTHTVGAFDWICDLGVKSILEEKYCQPVWIENDGKCRALEEFWKRNLSDVKNGMFIGLITHIAGEIILEGKFYSEFHGRFRVLERYRSGDSIARNALNEYSKTIAAGIVNLQSVLDVESSASVEESRLGTN